MVGKNDSTTGDNHSQDLARCTSHTNLGVYVNFSDLGLLVPANRERAHSR